MKKSSAFGILVMVCSSLLVLGCKKTAPVEIENVPEFSEKLGGTWTSAVIATSQVLEDNTDPESSIGDISIRLDSTATFNSDLTFSIKSSQKIEKMAVMETESVSLEDVRNYVEGTVEYTGTFKADKDNIEFTIMSVDAKGQKLTFEEYLEINPAAGKKTQRTSYKLEDNTLTVDNNVYKRK